MTEADAFIRASTRLVSPPCVPEIRLHLAEEPISLWEQTEVELGCTGLPPPFWAFAWAGGQALARYVLDHPGVVAGRRVLDVASGCGLVAIAAAVAGAATVAATEVDQLAVAAIGLNAEANGVTVSGALEDLLDGEAGGAEVVLAATSSTSGPWPGGCCPSSAGPASGALPCWWAIRSGPTCPGEGWRRWPTTTCPSPGTWRTPT